MRHYFSDTNVVLDFLARREPFAEVALTVFQAGLEKLAFLYVASLSFSNLYYTLRKQTNPKTACALMAHLQSLVTIVAVDASTISQAVTGPFADFEDAIQYYAAAAVPLIEVIITRDLRDFAPSTLLVLTPTQALTHLAAA